MYTIYINIYIYIYIYMYVLHYITLHYLASGRNLDDVIKAKQN